MAVGPIFESRQMASLCEGAPNFRGVIFSRVRKMVEKFMDFWAVLLWSRAVLMRSNTTVVYLEVLVPIRLQLLHRLRRPVLFRRETSYRSRGAGIYPAPADICILQHSTIGACRQPPFSDLGFENGPNHLYFVNI